MHMPLLILLLKDSLMHGYGTLSQIPCQPFMLFCIHHHTYVIYCQAHFNANIIATYIHTYIQVHKTAIG
jgi:hypothetical protein